MNNPIENKEGKNSITNFPENQAKETKKQKLEKKKKGKSYVFVFFF